MSNYVARTLRFEELLRPRFSFVPKESAGPNAFSQIARPVTMQGIADELASQRSLWVCAVQRRRFPVGASPTRQSLQPEATGAVMEVTKWLKPSV